VESSEGCPSHRLCGGYIIRRLRSSSVHMMGWFHVLFFGCALQAIAMPRDPRILCNATCQTAVAAYAARERLSRAISNRHLHGGTHMSTEHSFPYTRRPSHHETRFVCLTCCLDNNIAPKRANKVLALDNASICYIAVIPMEVTSAGTWATRGSFGT
jgi:hypothetical protein